jgi:hypothetical protein
LVWNSIVPRFFFQLVESSELRRNLSPNGIDPEIWGNSMGYVYRTLHPQVAGLLDNMGACLQPQSGSPSRWNAPHATGAGIGLGLYFTPVDRSGGNTVLVEIRFGEMDGIAGVACIT